MITALQMTATRKENMIKWFRKYISKGDAIWDSIIFNDEKKFDRDGPDGLACYWHDLRTKERIFSKQQMGRFSVMIWGAICLYGVSPLVFIDGRQDSNRYCQVLTDRLLPFAAEVFGEGQTGAFS